MTEAEGVIRQCHAALTTAGVSLNRSDGAPRPLLERIAILADERNCAREEGWRAGFEKARDKANEEAVDVARNYRPGSMGRAVAEKCAERIRAMQDERAGGGQSKREWHGCFNPAGHRFSNGVCAEDGCGFDLRKVGGGI